MRFECGMRRERGRLEKALDYGMRIDGDATWLKELETFMMLYITRRIRRHVCW